MKLSKAQLLVWFFLIGVIVLLSAAISGFFQQIPLEGNTLAMDWRINWPSLAAGLPYVIAPPLVDHLPYPPWSMIPLLPLGLFPMQVTWGWMALFTMMVLIVSVPHTTNRLLYIISIVALVFSYPAIRTIVDGNPEALILAGILLILSGCKKQNAYLLASGLLLATAKPQTLSLFLLATVFFVLRTFPRRLWLKSAGLILIVMIPALIWRGQSWLQLMLTIPQQGSIMDISMMAALDRAQLLPPVLNWLIWLVILITSLYVAWMNTQTFSREKGGMLIAASLLIAPYAANTLTLLAVGVIPFFQKRPLPGGIILGLSLGLIFFNNPAYRDVLGYISTFVLLLTWLTLLWSVAQDKKEDVKTVSPSPVQVQSL